MAYIIHSSEQNAARGNDMETRALLHLLCSENEYSEINGFAIDFFNDVTGVDRMAYKLVDIQSKASKSGAKDIGAELVTLFKNHVSDFAGYFVAEILFLGSVRDNVFDGEKLSQFRFSDICPKAQQTIRESLRDECLNKSYIDDEYVTEDAINSFLDEVIFVVSEPSVEDYITPLVRSAKAIVPTSDDLRAIFNEIRKAQVGIKTRSKVEGLEIEHPYEAYEYGRVLLRSDIELLVINRLINKNPLEAGIPTCFVPIYNKLMQNAPEEAEERIEDCQDALARQMFAASEATSFWALLNEIVTLIHNNSHASVEEVFRELNPETLSNCKFLDVLSAQYFIAIVKDGLK